MKNFHSLLRSNVFVLFVSLLSIFSTSCSKDSDIESNKEEVATVKPRFIWIDAAANFRDFANSKENITRDLTLAAEAGFTDIVVDVRPVTGDILFKSSHCEQVAWLGAWVDGIYTKVERTAEWDYLGAFIEEGKKLGLRVHAGFNTFTGGKSSIIGNQGILFRDAEKANSWATTLNLSTGLTSIMDASAQTTKFFNPVNVEVQHYLLSLLHDLASNYPELDGIFLDRGRFDGFTSDFSTYTKTEFEKYLGTTVSQFPQDILPVGYEKKELPSMYPKHMQSWFEFRAKVIHDFMVSAKDEVKGANPDIKFGVYVGGWYSTYYDVGVNWASPNYKAEANFKWATSKFSSFGYADHMDQMLIGAYAAPDKVYGGKEWTMQGFCIQAKMKTGGDCPLVVGGPDVGNWDYLNKFTPAQENDAITESVKACYRSSDGYFLFDMIHLKLANQWQYVKAGIDEVI